MGAQALPVPLSALTSTDIRTGQPAPTVTTTIFITTTLPTSSATSRSNQVSVSEDKAIIVGATVGAFLACVGIALLLWWFCTRNTRHGPYPTRRVPTERSGNIDVAAPETLEKRSPLGFGFLSRTTKGDTSNSLRPGPRPFLGENEEASQSFAPSFDGTNPPFGIPMVQPSFATHSGSSSPRSRIVEKLKRVSGTSDSSPILKPAPYQYGVVGSVGSRRASVNMILGQQSSPTSPTSPSSMPLMVEGEPSTSGPLPQQRPEPGGGPSPLPKPLGLGLHGDEALRSLVSGLEPYVYNGVYSQVMVLVAVLLTRESYLFH